MARSVLTLKIGIIIAIIISLAVLEIVLNKQPPADADFEIGLEKQSPMDTDFILHDGEGPNAGGEFAN